MPEEPQIPKEELYFSGMPLNQDPSKPLPGEIRPTTHRRFVRTGKIIVLVGAGVVLGALFAPETPNDMQKRLAVLEEELKDKQQQIEELERSITYKTDDVGGKFENNNSTGALKLADRLRHMRKADATPQPCANFKHNQRRSSSNGLSHAGILFSIIRSRTIVPPALRKP
ncbi:MAG: YtxH domain-containing protein [Myxococcota bacterium]